MSVDSIGVHANCLDSAADWSDVQFLYQSLRILLMSSSQSVYTTCYLLAQARPTMPCISLVIHVYVCVYARTPSVLSCAREQCRRAAETAEARETRRQHEREQRRSRRAADTARERRGASTSGINEGVGGRQRRLRLGR